MTIVKLGGSVITHKDKSPPQMNRKAIVRIVKELGVSIDKLVIVLGGGSYGHQPAHLYGYGNDKTPRNKLLDGIGPIHKNMIDLSIQVADTLNRYKIRTVVFSPFTHVIMHDGAVSAYPTELIKRSLKSEYTVLTHGDVCLDEVRGASILSGDTIIVHLAKSIGARRVLIGTNVDGVMEQNPTINPAAKYIPIISHTNMNEVLHSAGPSDTTDVTGGMHRKITELLELAKTNTAIHIFNLSVPGRLKALLQGHDTICTTITV